MKIPALGQLVRGLDEDKMLFSVHPLKSLASELPPSESRILWFLKWDDSSFLIWKAFQEHLQNTLACWIRSLIKLPYDKCPHRERHFYDQRWTPFIGPSGCGSESCFSVDLLSLLFLIIDTVYILHFEWESPARIDTVYLVWWRGLLSFSPYGSYIPELGLKPFGCFGASHDREVRFLGRVNLTAESAPEWLWHHHWTMRTGQPSE